MSLKLYPFPHDEQEAGAWLSGLAWAFVLHWVILIAVTAAYVGGHG